MPATRPVVVALIALCAALAAARAAAGERGDDEMLVIARDVMPRLAVRGLEPTQNPVRVEATVFPGAVFHGTLDGLLGRLVGEETLGETAAPAPLAMRADGPAPVAFESFELRGPVAIDHAPVGGGGAGGGSIGGMIVGATSGLADTITRATMQASTAGGGR